jgi:hypothetical protein
MQLRPATDEERQRFINPAAKSPAAEQPLIPSLASLALGTLLYSDPQVEFPPNFAEIVQEWLASGCRGTLFS